MSLSKRCLAELFGTFWLVFGGCGAAIFAAGFPSVGIGFAGVAFAFGLTVLTMAYAIGHVSGCHLNPAVTLAFACLTGDFGKLPVYVPAQFLGAFCGAVLVWLHHLPLWKETSDPGFKLGIFCTAPAVRSLGSNLVSEIIGTIVLIVGVGAIFSKAVAASGPVPGFGPYLVGILVWAIGLSLGGPTGYAINPARDLGPRIAHAVLPIPGKGGSDWGYSWVPVVGPAIGAAIGALVLHIVS